MRNHAHNSFPGTTNYEKNHITNTCNYVCYKTETDQTNSLHLVDAENDTFTDESFQSNQHSQLKKTSRSYNTLNHFTPGGFTV